MQIHLKTLGCRLNEAEIESWANKFKIKEFSSSNLEEHFKIIEKEYNLEKKALETKRKKEVNRKEIIL